MKPTRKTETTNQNLNHYIFDQFQMWLSHLLERWVKTIFAVDKLHTQTWIKWHITKPDEMMIKLLFNGIFVLYINYCISLQTLDPNVFRRFHLFFFKHSKVKCPTNWEDCLLLCTLLKKKTNSEFFLLCASKWERKLNRAQHSVPFIIICVIYFVWVCV